MLAPLYHVLPLATIERERTLPVAGEVLTKLNQKVSSIGSYCRGYLGA